jgi:DNA-binding NarL/FixJ family response regulator
MGRAVLQRLGRDASRSLARVEIAEALTPRETQILRLLATGAANKEIAAEIGTSEATVKVHLKSLYAKLGVGSRSAAAAIAVAAGV